MGTIEYPPQFSAEARAAVEAQLIRAEREHAKRKREWDSDWHFPERQSIKTYILTVFLSYARQAIELEKKGMWAVDEVRSQALEGLRRITIMVAYKEDCTYFLDGPNIRSEIQRDFKDSSEWQQFEEELVFHAERLKVVVNQVQGLAEEAIPSAPELSDSTKRRLAVQWETIRDKQKLTDEDLVGYDLGRQWLLRVVAKPPQGMNLGGLNTSQPRQAAVWLGLDPSTRAAVARLSAIDWEYWRLWCASGSRYEAYRDWLGSVSRRILAEFASIWEGRSAVTDRWFRDTCAPAIEKALADRVKQRIAQAREVEMRNLERQERERAQMRRTSPMPISQKFGVTPDEPLGPNPFANEDPLHELFLEASRCAKRELALFNANVLAKMPSEDAQSDWQAWWVDTAAGQFGIKIAAVVAAFGTNAENLTACERIIDQFAEQTLSIAKERLGARSAVPLTLISELWTKMLQYREYSIGQAYRLLSTPQRKEAIPKANGNGTDQPSTHESAGYDADVVGSNSGAYPATTHEPPIESLKPNGENADEPAEIEVEGTPTIDTNPETVAGTRWNPEPQAEEALVIEVKRRKNLIKEYMSATGSPSHRKIYRARNSGIHKPEFYSWLNGELAATSQTAVNFERFLTDKKSPIPRDSKD